MKLNILLLILISLVSFSCSEGKKEGEECSDSEVFCQTKVGGGVSPVVNTLRLQCEDSHYYDSNVDEWRTIQKSRIEAGDVGTISVFSNILTTDINMALQKTKDSLSHFNDKDEVFLPEDYNVIPFIKCKVESGEKISFEFRKIDGNKNVISLIKGDAFSNEGYAYIPFVNEMFSGQFLNYGTTPSSVKDLSYSITLQAKSPNSNPSPLKKIDFKMTLEVPLKGIKVTLSDSWKSFSLKNRWTHYYKGSDEVINDAWELASLVDNQETADSLPYDIRFVFRETPVLKMKQVTFVEETLDLLLYDTLGVNVSSRGERFYQNTQELNSNSHFKSKFTINKNFVELVDGTTLEMRDIPAGKKWNLGFLYDFTKNISYDSNYDLLTPFKSECHKINGQKANPINEATLKATAKSTGKERITCHPNTNTNETRSIGAAGALPDTHFEFFNYRRDSLEETSDPNVIKKDIGNFSGIRSVDFYIEGCVKFYIREASVVEVNPNPWEQKNIHSEECGSGEYTYFSINVGDSIFNYVEDYKSNQSLVNLINRLGSAITREKNNYHFNNSPFLEVIY